MTMKTAIFFLLMLSPLSLPASDNVLVIGGGSYSCGKWLELRKDLSSHYQLRQWVLGFVSGSNYNAQQKQSSPPDIEAVVVFVDQYCKNNPLHLLLHAAAAVVQETGGRKAEHQWKH